MEFTAILLDHVPAGCAQQPSFDMVKLGENLLASLTDRHDDVKERVTDVLLLYAKHAGGVQAIIQKIVKVIYDAPDYFDNNGLFIIRSLCHYEAAETVYICLASSLLEIQDKEFKSQFVQMLNWLLMTGEETSDLRRRLRGCAYGNQQKRKDDVKLFDKL